MFKVQAPALVQFDCIRSIHSRFSLVIVCALITKYSCVNLKILAVFAKPLVRLEQMYYN